jgi:hypothetical protein
MSVWKLTKFWDRVSEFCNLMALHDLRSPPLALLKDASQIFAYNLILPCIRQ